MIPVQSNRLDRPLRVAFLTPSLHIGGAERWILSLARNFLHVRPAGVVLCAPHFHPDVIQQAARLMPVYAARKYGDPGETRRLLQRACADADVLITWGVPRLEVVTRGLVGRISNPSVEVNRRIRTPGDVRHGIPVVDVSHSDGAWEQQTKMVRRAASGADFHVAVSRCALSAFPEEVRERAFVIYNGVEVDRVAPRRSPHPNPLPEGEGISAKTALFLGRFEHVKGFDRLVEAAKFLPKNWTIVAHGHGSLCSTDFQVRANMRTVTHTDLEVRATSRLHIRPPVRHVGDVLAAADVLVMPSRFEGMPLTLIEAWLAGTPAVTTPIGFVREAEAMHGRLCEVVSPEPTGEELAAGILRAAEGKYVERARNVAWQNYTAAAMAQRWEEFLYAACSVFGFRCSEKR